ncbi:MAG: hypothetical protein HUJ99_08765 [Bacteroidaceae bacterium]|nr:hypothetical protein [Bacteroidaceae bacterium]
MAIQKRHHGTLGDLSGLGAPDLSFNESEAQQPSTATNPTREEANAPQTVEAVQPQPAATTQLSTPTTEVEKPRPGRPKGIKGAGPKRLNLIQGDKDKVLALQLPSKLIEGLRRYAEDHDITMKELIGKTLMKKIGPKYYL